MTAFDQHALIVYLYEVKKLPAHRIAGLAGFSYRVVWQVLSQENARRTAAMKASPHDAASGEGAESQVPSGWVHKGRRSQ